MADTELHLRKAIIEKCRWMNASGLNQGTSGNISARHGETMLISPSATPYDSLTPDMIAAMPIDREYGSWRGPLKAPRSRRIVLSGRSLVRTQADMASSRASRLMKSICNARMPKSRLRSVACWAMNAPWS